MSQDDERLSYAIVHGEYARKVDQMRKQNIALDVSCAEQEVEIQRLRKELEHNITERYKLARRLVAIRNAAPVIVAPDADSCLMNTEHGESYGVDCEYPAAEVSPAMTDTMREAFEDWFPKKDFGPNGLMMIHAEYVHAPAATYWKVWQAATLAERESCARVCEKWVRTSDSPDICAAEIPSTKPQVVDMITTTNAFIAQQCDQAGELVMLCDDKAQELDHD